jgi:uncharacterized repeat protein (TIGR01451 family)
MKNSAGTHMTNSYSLSLQQVRLARIVPWAIVTATISFATLAGEAQAAGTTAGSTISNTATATYTDSSGNPATTPSNTVDLVVDELLDVTVASADPGDVPTTPGATNQVLSFTVTNTGNGSEAFTLTPNGTVGGDNFDPTTTSIVLDDGDGVYEPLQDTVYTPGTNDPVLAPDASIKVFVLSTIPAGAVDGNQGNATLTAAAVTGTGAPGTTIANAGQGGGDAVVGSTGADGVDTGTYIVQSATVTLAKSAAVADPFGGTSSVPGSVITYTLLAEVTGTGSLTGLTIGDAVPTGTTYQTGSITLQGSPITDATDADAGEFASSAVAVRLGNVSGGTTRTVTFKVIVN